MSRRGRKTTRVDRSKDSSWVPKGLEARFAQDREKESASSKPSGTRLTEGIPLAAVIKRKLLPQPELVFGVGGNSPAAERFRRLKIILEEALPDSGGILVVTSPAPSEGKSMIAMNLALSFAEDNRGQVMIVDGDLRRPSLNRFVRPMAKFGMHEILADKTTLKHCVLELEAPALKILPAGEATSDPVELLSSNQARELFQVLRAEYRIVIIDCSPIIPFTDADVLARYSDGVLLVARSGTTAKAMLKRAIESISTSEVLGVVLNDQPFNLADGASYYDKYYRKYYDREKPS